MLNALIFNFYLILIQHRLEDYIFDNIIIFFYAVLAWDFKEKIWMKVLNYNSFLNYLIYFNQLLIF